MAKLTKPVKGTAHKSSGGAAEPRARATPTAPASRKSTPATKGVAKSEKHGSGSHYSETELLILCDCVEEIMPKGKCDKSE
jgi:hypothetical protein